MKRVHFFLAGGAAILLSLTMAMGESIESSSAPFAFPGFPSINHPGKAVVVSTFKIRGYSPASGSVSIDWAVRAASGVKSGRIAIYTLQGKTVAVFPVAGSAGTVTWKLSEKQGMSGVYLAKLLYGSATSQSKLVICK